MRERSSEPWTGSSNMSWSIHPTTNSHPGAVLTSRMPRCSLSSGRPADRVVEVVRERVDAAQVVTLGHQGPPGREVTRPRLTAPARGALGASLHVLLVRHDVLPCGPGERPPPGRP